MRNISYLKVDESIDKQRLVYKKDLFDKMDDYFYIFIFLAALLASYNLLSLVDFKNSNDSFFAIIYLLFPIIAFCFLIRKIFEYRLKVIKTHNNQELNREKILKYIEENGLEIYRNNQKCVIFNHDHDSFNHCATTIVLFKSKNVFYTTIRDKFKTNTPTIFTHIFIKHDLKKILTKSL